MLLVLIRTQCQNCRIAQSTTENSQLDYQQETDIAIDNRQDISTDVQAEPFAQPMTSSSNPVSNTNTEVHNLTDIMERFVQLEAFKWKTDDEILPIHYVLGDVIAGKRYWKKKYSFPQDIFLNSSTMRQKANNFMLMRANLVFDLKVNADPFKAGSLLVAYYPRATEDTFRTTANEFLASVTSAPHRILNLEESNSLRFEVPYANELDYINLTNDANQFGSIFIWPLTPLRGEGDSNDVSVVVRARFSDVKLEVPTNNSLESNRDYVEADIARLQILLRGMKAQGAEGESLGPVSKISNTVGKVAESLEWIPFIGDIAKTVGWVSRGVTKVAQVFGYSKPIMLQPTTSVTQQPAKYMCNTEGQDNSVVLAQIPDNAINVSSSVPETEDEMALKYLFSKPNIFLRDTITANEFTGNSLIAKWNVSPVNAQAVQDDQTLSLGSFGFTSTLGLYWRGSIEYTITLVKTCYHAGRYIAVYFPNTVADNLPATYDETMTTNLNVIYDLKEKSEGTESIEKPFIVPYSSEYPWKRTLQVADGIVDTASMSSCNGSVGVYALTDLISPDAVSSTIDILVKHRGGEDYEIALPQLQLRAGYSMAIEEEEPEFQLRQWLQEVYGGVRWNLTANLAAGDEVPALTTDDGGNYNFPQGDSGQERRTVWPLVANAPPSGVPDGTYEFEFPITVLSENEELNWTFTDTLSWQVTISGGATQVLTIPAATFKDAFNGTTSGTMVFSGFKAQGADETHDPIPEARTVAPINKQAKTAEMTTGEYFYSTRNLLKRFCLMGQLNVGVWSYCPSTFENSVNPKFYGTRSVKYEGEEVLIPESWMSMLSYLFRFYAGSTRTKFIGDSESVFKTWLRIKNTTDVEDELRVVDPVHAQLGNVNPILETHVPYYGNTRARVVGQSPTGFYSAHQVVQLSNSADLYEAAGDDFSFWFVVGPPPMTAISTSSFNRDRVLSTADPFINTGYADIPY